MTNTLKVRSVEIGAAQPKIISSILEKKDNDVLKKAEELRDMQIDVIEWCVDFYENILDIPHTLDLLAQLRVVLRDMPILFAFRTKNEGGEMDISMEDYTALNIAVAESGNVDMVDVQMFLGDDIAQKNVDAIHKAGVLVVGSNHDFQATPPRDELVRRLRKMQDMGADIPKIAVMPNNIDDVLTLLTATNEMNKYYADRPIIAISMGALGLVSRLFGEVFGSAMTFGTVGLGTAPGQISVEKVAQVQNILHSAL